MVLYYIFFESNFIVRYHPKKVCGTVVVLENSTHKINLQQFFWQCWRLYGSNFNGTGLHQRALLEKFMEKNRRKIGFFKVTNKGKPRMFSLT